MRGQFRVQRTLQNRLGQLLQKTVLPGYLFHRRTPLQQLIDQLPIQSHSISSQLVEKIVYTIWFTPSGLLCSKLPMLRAPQEIRTFFVTSVTANRRRLFQVEANANLLLDVLEQNRSKDRFQIHAFVVMPHHIHLLLTPAKDVSLEKAIQFIKAASLSNSKAN